MARLELSERRPWTREEYERAIALGLFRPEEKLELIEGEIVRKMTQGVLHVAATGQTAEALRPLFPGHHIRVQMPLALGRSNEPEPDVAVVTGNFGDYLSSHPTTAVLVVEVSDTSLTVDRSKASVYARAGIPEYWIVNLPDRQVEVHREPGPASEQPLGFHYASVTAVSLTGQVSPLAAPGAAVMVASLLP